MPDRSGYGELRTPGHEESEAGVHPPYFPKRALPCMPPPQADSSRAKEEPSEQIVRRTLGIHRRPCPGQARVSAWLCHAINPLSARVCKYRVVAQARLQYTVGQSTLTCWTGSLCRVMCSMPGAF